MARLRFVSDLMPEGDFGGELLVYDPPRTLEMRWGTDILRFELAVDGDGTLLTLTDTIEERGTAARTGAGWHTCLDTLAYALVSQAPAVDRGAALAPGPPSYVSQYGPEAATIGPPVDPPDAGHRVLSRAGTTY